MKPTKIIKQEVKIFGVKTTIDLPTFGKCPLCKKGNIYKDHYKDTDVYKCTERDCKLFIWSSFSNKTLTDDELSQLFEKGETKNNVTDLKSKKGLSYNAILFIDTDGRVRIKKTEEKNDESYEKTEDITDEKRESNKDSDFYVK